MFFGWFLVFRGHVGQLLFVEKVLLYHHCTTGKQDWRIRSSVGNIERPRNPFVMNTVQFVIRSKFAMVSLRGALQISVQKATHKYTSHMYRRKCQQAEHRRKQPELNVQNVLAWHTYRAAWYFLCLVVSQGAYDEPA